MITKEKFTFKGNEIYDISVVEYVEFDNDNWIENREKLVAWVAINQPDLNGFIHNQTKQGGEDYLNALRLYQKSKAIEKTN